MTIIYHDGNGQPGHVIYVHPQDYDPTLNGEHFVLTDEAMAHDRIYLVRGEDGSFEVTAKRDMRVAISAPLYDAVAGSEIRFVGIPEGARLAIHGEILGTMDETEILEFTPETSGFFEIVFSLAGYMDWSTTLEVVRPE